MGKNSRNKQLAELEAKYRGRVEPELIKMIFEESGYKLSEADGQLQALAPPPDPTEVAQFPPMQPAKLSKSAESKRDPSTEDVDKFNPVDADPIFAQLRREFPEEALDSDVLQLILDGNRQRSIQDVRERLIDLTGYDPEVEREKQRLARAAQREAERNAKTATSTAAAGRGSSTSGLKPQDSSASFLHTMFPRVKPASILDALGEANGDIELALEKLLCLYAIKDDESLESADSSTASTATDFEDDETDEDEESEEDDFRDFEEYYEEDPIAAIERLPPAHPISGRRKRKTQEDEEDEDPLDMKAKLQILKDLFPNHTEKTHLSSLLASNQLLSEAVDRLVQMDHPNTYLARLKHSDGAQQQQQQRAPRGSGKRAGTTKITLSLGEYMAQDEDWEPAPSDAPLKVGYDLDMASKLKLNQLIALFPGVSDQIIHDVFIQHDLNADQTTKALHLMGAESKSLQHVHVGPVAAAGSSAQGGPKVVQGHNTSSWAKAAVSNKPSPAHQPQAVTVVGSAAAAAEPAARPVSSSNIGGGASIQGVIKNAAELAELRNWFFRQAARCYQLGHGALARHFSEQGREVGQQMHSAHVLAARQSFYEQNNQIDLHGLNVKPAIALLEELLDLHEKKQRSAIFTGEQATTRLQVITGAGNHSTGRRARIKPAVIKLLKERGYRFTEANSGALDVFLK